MPMFVTVPTSDLATSADFWTRRLGFIDLFTINHLLLGVSQRAMRCGAMCSVLGQT